MTLPDPSRLLSQLRFAAVILALAGLGLIASGGARGPATLMGFGMFCLGLASLDGLYRRRFGFRQAAVFLGWFAAGMALWASVASGLSGLLQLPVSEELDSLLIAAAGCAAGCAAASLLSVSNPGPMLWGWLVATGRRLRALAARPDSRRSDPQRAERRWRPAGSARGD